MAITIDVGKIKLVWRSTYNNSTAYTPDDLVQYDDGSTTSAYICIANTTGNIPSTSGSVNTTYWNLVAQGASAVSGGNSNGQIQYKVSTGFGATTGFAYDTTNNRLGVGTASPNSTLQVVGVSSLSTLYSPSTTIENLVVSGISTLGVTTVTNTLKYQHVLEKTNILTTANGTSNLDIKTFGAVFLFTTNSSATWTHNIRGDGSTTLNSMLDVGQAITVVVLSKQNNTAYYTSALNIDGSSATVNWLGGTAPSAGASSAGYDAYAWNIIKTGNATFTVIASQTRYG